MAAATFPLRRHRGSGGEILCQLTFNQGFNHKLSYFSQIVDNAILCSDSSAPWN